MQTQIRRPDQSATVCLIVNHVFRHKTTPIKMKPKPSGFSFEEKSARAILRPFSHHKYIHEPPADSVVYISRRNGIVPLFRSVLS